MTHLKKNMIFGMPVMVAIQPLKLVVLDLIAILVTTLLFVKNATRKIRFTYISLPELRYLSKINHPKTIKNLLKKPICYAILAMKVFWKQAREFSFVELALKILIEEMCFISVLNVRKQINILSTN